MWTIALGIILMKNIVLNIKYLLQATRIAMLIKGGILIKNSRLFERVGNTFCGFIDSFFYTCTYWKPITPILCKQMQEHDSKNIRTKHSISSLVSGSFHYFVSKMFRPIFQKLTSVVCNHQSFKLQLNIVQTLNMSIPS